MERVESQLSLGTERMLESIIDWTRTILLRVRRCNFAHDCMYHILRHQDQRKTDFKPDENGQVIDIVSSTLVIAAWFHLFRRDYVLQACQNTRAFIGKVLKTVQKCLNGKVWLFLPQKCEISMSFRILSCSLGSWAHKSIARCLTTSAHSSFPRKVRLMRLNTYVYHHCA